MVKHKTYLICEQCGSRDSFSRATYGTCKFSEIEVCDSHGETTTYDSYEDYDHDISEYGDYKCEECDQESCVVEFAKVELLINYMVLHTDKSGNWHHNDLPTGKRSDKIVMMFVAEEV